MRLVDARHYATDPGRRCNPGHRPRGWHRGPHACERCEAIRNCVEASLLRWPQTGLRHKPDCGMSYDGFRRVGRVRGLWALEQRQCKT